MDAQSNQATVYQEVGSQNTVPGTRWTPKACPDQYFGFLGPVKP